MPRYHRSVLPANHNPYVWLPRFRHTLKPLLSTEERWRKVAKILKVSGQARARLEWVIYSREGYTVQQTCRHFNIARKTFYKWTRFFDEDNLYSLYLLEDKSRAPKRTRTTTLTQVEELRIVALRRQHMAWGSKKLSVVYGSTYGSAMSAWHVERTIRTWKLYRNPRKLGRTVAKRARTRARGRKRRLIELADLPRYQQTAGYIICLDTVVIYWSNVKRYFFTAIDKYAKVAYARMYTTKSSANAADFLMRLRYLYGEIPRVGHDNGSEFADHFQAACQQLGIEQHYSRVHTPKDNAECERFNQTLQTEFLDLGNFSPDPTTQNRTLTEWLIEYNFQRPHETLSYQTPIRVARVSPMSPVCTQH
jgi:transposase InsO family protein